MTSVTRIELMRTAGQRRSRNPPCSRTSRADYAFGFNTPYGLKASRSRLCCRSRPPGRLGSAVGIKIKTILHPGDAFGVDLWNAPHMLAARLSLGLGQAPTHGLWRDTGIPGKPDKFTARRSEVHWRPGGATPRQVPHRQVSEHETAPGHAEPVRVNRPWLPNRCISLEPGGFIQRQQDISQYRDRVDHQLLPELR
jgi:hypothetical protein